MRSNDDINVLIDRRLIRYNLVAKKDIDEPLTSNIETVTDHVEVKELNIEI